MSVLLNGMNGVLATALAASVLIGAAMYLLKRHIPSNHQDPLWLVIVISAGCGILIPTVTHVLGDASVNNTASFLIWQVMALGAACGALGAWVPSYLVNLVRKVRGDTPRWSANGTALARRRKPPQTAAAPRAARPDIHLPAFKPNIPEARSTSWEPEY